MPITWRNVQSRSNSDAVALLRGASDSINRGLGNFQDIFKGRDKARQAQSAKEKANNTDTYLDRLAGFNSVEDVQGAQESGMLEELRASLGPNIDRGKVRGAADARVATLTGLENNQYTREHNEAKRAAAPLEQAYLAAKARNDDAGADAILQEGKEPLTAAGILGRLSQQGAAQDRSELEQGRADTAFNRNETQLSQTDQLTDFLGTSLDSENASAVNSRAAVHQYAADNNIPYAVAESVAAQADQKFESKYGFSTAQNSSLQSVQSNAARAADTDKQIVSQQWAQDQEAYAVDQRFTFGASDRTTVGDAIKTATDNGWDIRIVRDEEGTAWVMSGLRVSPTHSSISI